MSTFAVTIERIGDIREHTNADRLEMATLAGKDYDFVVQKGQFQPGDVVVYFPIDSELPEWVSDILGLTGKLAGSEHNRVKTMKLRGNISQGVVAAPDAFAERLPTIVDAPPGTDITDLLGVTKYEPPPIMSDSGTLRPLPAFVWKYDIESAQNHTTIVDVLLDAPVCVTEKLEGSHWSVTWSAEDDAITVSQRNYRIEPNGKGVHTWHKVAERDSYADKLRAIASAWGNSTGTSPKAVTIRGEIVGPGVQGNYYKLPDHQVYVFDIEIDGTAVDCADFFALTAAHDIPTVPVLARDIPLRVWLNGQTLKSASNGRSQIADKAREGIVITPMHEGRDDALGRIILKQRSPEYLAKSDY